MPLNLQNIPAPTVIEDVSFDNIFSLIHSDFLARDPAYIDLIESDPGYMLMESAAYIIVFALERVNRAVAAVLITHATGSDLDNLAALFSLTRNTGESDDHFRSRVVDRLETIVAGSITWYRRYVVDLEVIEVLGSDNIVDNIPTPVISRVADAHVQLTPNPSYDDSMDISDTNLPDIPGSIDIYVQSSRWTHPDTGVLTQVVPSARMLQAVKNYIAAEGIDETDEDLVAAAENRRFICDTVNVLPAKPHPYIYCAFIRVAEGLDRVEVLRDVQQRARDFVEENERVGERIPLSAFYDVINTEDVTEVILEHPQADIEPDDDAVTVVFNEHPLELENYREFVDVATFAALTGNVWTVGEHTSKWWLLVKVDVDSQDYEYLSYLRVANRISITAQDNMGDPTGQPLETLRIMGELARIPATGTITHYQVELMGEPTITGLTDDTDYSLKILDSVEIRLV